MNDVNIPTAVVVGVDGSAGAVQAALWAADEAVSRDVPLRLVYAIDPAAAGVEDMAHQLATAEIAVRYAYTAVEATEKPVKIEIEIVQSTPTAALTRASASAAVICVGAVGFRHFSDRHLGSTAEALAGRAHCPVAIVRNRKNKPAGDGDRVVTLVDDTAGSSAVLQVAVEEALLRHAPLRVATAFRADDTHARGRLERSLTQWTNRHSDLDVRAELVHGRMLDFIAGQAAHTRVLVVKSHRETVRHGLFSPNGYAALHDTPCTLLIAEASRPL